jgi:hypothetical protein
MQAYGEKTVGGSISPVGSKKINSIQSISIEIKDVM